MTRFRRTPLTHDQANQQGVALLAALILMLAVVLTLGNIFYRHQIDVSQVTDSLHSDQALLLALSAESWAKQLLSSDQDDRDVDSLDEDWARATPLLPVDGGFLRGCLIDLQSRINVNNFASYNSEIWDEQVVEGQVGFANSFLELLESLQLPSDPGKLAVIIDWVDTNNEQVNQWGAEQADYEFEQTPQAVANSMITDVTELALLREYNAQLVRQLMPWLTALPRETAVNINTASKPLLEALTVEDKEQFAEFVLNNRPFDNLDAFYKTAGDLFSIEEAEAKLRWPQNMIAVKTDYFQLNMEIALGNAQLEIKSIIDRHQRDEPVVIAREVAVVPSVIPNNDEEQGIPPLCQANDESNE